MSFTRVVTNGHRFYNIPGINEALPSVTTILGMINKPWFNVWQQNVVSNQLRGAMRVKFNTPKDELVWFEYRLKDAINKPDKIKEEAATLGSQAHDFIDQHLLTGMPPLSTIPEHIRPMIEGFEIWRKQAQLKFVGRDSMVYSKTFRYAGSFDALARKTTDNSLVIIDWKTSNRISNEYAYQVAAYAHAHQEMTNDKVDEAWVVRFDKTKPVFEVKKVKNLQKSFQIFLAALNLFRAQEATPWFPPEPIGDINPILRAIGGETNTPQTGPTAMTPPSNPNGSNAINASEPTATRIIELEDVNLVHHLIIGVTTGATTGATITAATTAAHKRPDVRDEGGIDCNGMPIILNLHPESFVPR